MDVFRVFDSVTVTQADLTHGRAAAVGSAGEHGLARKLPVPANAVSSAVDQVVGVIVDETSHETLLGDLAFEQVTSGTRKDSRGWSFFGG